MATAIKPIQMIMPPATDAQSAINQYSLGQKQAMIDALRQGSMNTQMPQQTGAMAAPISPISTFAQMLGGYLANKQQTNLNQQKMAAYNQQYNQALDMYGGAQQGQQQDMQQEQQPNQQMPQQTQLPSQVAQLFNNPNMSQDIQSASQASPQTTQPAQSQIDWSQPQDDRWKTAYNPGGINPNVMVRARMTMDPDKFNAAYIEPYIKPIEYQHTRDGLFTFNPRNGSYYSVGDLQHKNPLTQDQLSQIRDNSQPDRFQHIGAGIMTDPTTGQPFITDEKGNRTALSSDQVAARLSKFSVDKSGGLDPNSIENTAQLIANNQMPMLSGFSLKTPWGQAVVSRVREINPQYNSNTIGVEKTAQTQFTSGKLGNTVRSLNVASSHLDTLSDLADALNNGNTQLINKIGNAWATQTGQAAPTSFDAAKKIVADEVVKAVVGAGGGVSDREEASKSINSAESPAQLKQVIQTYKTLMIGQLHGLQQQYEQSTGKTDFNRFLKNDNAAPPNTNAKGWVLHTDKNGNKAYVSPDGKQYEEVK